MTHGQQPELPADAGPISNVHDAAFAPLGDTASAEAELVRTLRADGAIVPGLSLVAERGGRVVGHVVCSRGHAGDRPALGLAPLGVLPEFQRRGVGTALMEAVIHAADALGEPCIALLGDPAYYSRFGFEPAHTAGIAAPDPAWREHFQIRRLKAWTHAMAGTFHYAAAFDRL